jgi:RHS repeat-associated protein
VVSAPNSGTSGTAYFDAFESRRSTYIGPASPSDTLTAITYTYDSLYRLTNANYSSGSVFTYTYDAVGNRLTQGTLTTTTIYTYDVANRLINAGGITYTWDANGNLLDDGASAYSYDAANRPITITQGGTTYTYTYNGLGDRRQQLINGVPTTYTLDLNAPLTQILADGSGNTYLYGPTRIGEQQPGGFAYHLPDALGSARQLTNASAQIVRVQTYEPFGSVLTTTGSAISVFGWAGEVRDATGLVFLRARYYSPTTGRFFVRDAWPGNTQMPGTLHPYLYSLSNPVNYADPSGHRPCAPWEAFFEAAITIGIFHVMVLDPCDKLLPPIDVYPTTTPTQWQPHATATPTQPLAPTPSPTPWSYQYQTATPTPPLVLCPTPRYYMSSGGAGQPIQVTPTPTSVVEPRRPGLPTRADSGWKKGQLTDDEFAFFQWLAQKRGHKIILTGSLTETDLGLQRRYDTELQKFLPDWRRPQSGLVDTGVVRDIDFGELSKLTDTEIQLILNKFQESYPDLRITDIDVKGYGEERYPKQGDFRRSGAIVFHPSGRTERIPAPWQLPNWPGSR